MTILAAIAILCIGLALAFDFVNGFHDTANAVATVIYSKALKPRTAILMCAFFNFLGALLVGTSVAMFITSVVPLGSVTLPLLVSVLVAGLTWNLLTWYVALPVSSSHCLIGSLVGAGVAANGIHGLNLVAFYKAVVALLVSPAVGFGVCLALAALIAYAVKKLEAKNINARKPLPYLQIASSAALSFSHGSNDGQKVMGIITLILATQFGSLGYTTDHVPFWVVAAAAAAIGIGTTTGGWRIIKTVGEKICNKDIDPIHGCASEISTAAIVFGASHLGVPVSTTHVLNSSVMGGTVALHGKGELNAGTLKNVLLAWILTLPVTALMAGSLYLLFSTMF